jgi:hypothetical protein
MDAWVQVKIKIGLLAYGPGVPANVSLSDWTI